ncbi:hypothetical protein AAF712_008608 [Marasmius tenuissimus]|uniref:Uncharacterized protein n=1 Tax=Marasmius tenuissimus TaxID=585030 RepID=A0ABR2ZTG3_9AGAR|nr:hypothetical protein PM082_007486 [Marasmius tenuissimus]
MPGPRFSYLWILRLVGILHLFCSVFARERDSIAVHNITVDGEDSRIVFSDGWRDAAAAASQGLDFGKGCHWSDEEGAYAEFTFTGSAVYLASSTWTHPVQAQLQLDEGQPVVVDLYSRTQRNVSDSVGPGMVRGFNGLGNGTHTLRIELPRGAKYVVVEALIYTAFISRAIETSPGAPQHTLSRRDHSSRSNDTTPTNPHTLRRRDSDSNKPVIIGVVVGLVIALFGVGIGIVMVCYRKTLLAKYGHLVGIHPASEDEALPTAITNSPQTTPKPATFPTPVFSAFTSDPRPENSPSGSVALREREKSLPTPPPPGQSNPSSPTKRLTRAIASLSSKRRPALTLQVSKHGPLSTIPAARSATSSFFTTFQENVSKENVVKKVRTSSVISQLDGGSEQPSRKPLAPIVHAFPPSTSAIRGSHERQDSTEERKEAWTSYRLNAREPSFSSVSASTSPETPISSSPEILGRHPYSSRNSTKSIKVGIPLASIAENLSRSPGGPDSPMSTRSTKSLSKRRSEGRARVEKEKQRRRQRKALPSPGGPRDRFSGISRPDSQIPRSPVAETRPPLPTVRRIPRPLPQRPISVARPPSSDSRPETPLPPYVVGNEILPLYFEKAKRATRKSLRSELLSATSSRHFLPSPPPSASGSSTGHETPLPEKTPSPRPLPTVATVVASTEPRKLPAPNRPRALTDTAALKPTLVTAPLHIRNRSADIPPPPKLEQSRQPPPSEPKPSGPLRRVVQKKSADSSISSSSLDHSKQRPPPLHSSKSDTVTTLPMRHEHLHRQTPTSLPVTPNLNSWSDAGTYQYTIQEESQDTGVEGTDLKRNTLQVPRSSRPGRPPSGPLPSPPTSSELEPKKITRKPPPVEVVPPVLDAVIDVGDEESATPLPVASPHTPTRNVVIPPSPNTPPPPTPPTPRRRVKIWDEFGRRRVAPITPTLFPTSSPLAQVSTAESESVSGASTA